MRQIWITKRGGPEVLQVREAADPVPKDGEVRIRVAAAGVNFAHVLARMRLYPDAPPLQAVVGYEVAGTVDWLEAEENYVRLHAGRERATWCAARWRGWRSGWIRRGSSACTARTS